MEFPRLPLLPPWPGLALWNSCFISSSPLEPHITSVFPWLLEQKHLEGVCNLPVHRTRSSLFWKHALLLGWSSGVLKIKTLHPGGNDCEVWSVRCCLRGWAGQPRTRRGDTALPAWGGPSCGSLAESSHNDSGWQDRAGQVCDLSSVPVDRCPPLEVDALVDSLSDRAKGWPRKSNAVLFVFTPRALARPQFVPGFSRCGL